MRKVPMAPNARKPHSAGIAAVWAARSVIAGAALPTRAQRLDREAVDAEGFGAPEGKAAPSQCVVADE